MKVLMLDPIDGNPYGPDLASAISAAGVDVRILVPRGSLNRARARCTTIAAAPRCCRGKYIAKLFDECGYLGYIARECVIWHPDILHVQWLKLPIELPLVRMAKAMGIRLVVTAHNPVPHEEGRRQTTVQRRLFASADRLIVHEKSAKQALLSALGAVENIDIIPLGASISAATYAPTKSVARVRHRIPPDEPVFLMFGGVRHYKGFDLILEAFRRASLRGVSARLLLAGWGRAEAVQDVNARIGAMEPEVQSRISSFLNTERPVAQELVDDLFAATDCVVLPYRGISHSSVLAQAFASGRPVLATSVGGFAELVTDRVNGRLVKAEDIDDLGSALEELADDRPMMEVMGAQAFQFATRELSWDKVAMKTIATYQRTVDSCAH